jgi:Flp pilus assembly protein TadD
VTAVCALAIALTGLWAYATSFGGVLVLDDYDSLGRNPSIRTLWPLTRALSPPPLLTVSGRPVANLTFAINYALAPAGVRDDFDPAASQAPDIAVRIARNLRGYHAGNLAIHLLAALALFGVIRRTLATPKLRARVGGTATPLALAVALVWLVHPLQTESVTYLVQRVESLMGLFYLLTLYCAIRAWEPRHSAAWSAAAVATCALGMATKEVMVTAPVIVWLWDWTFGEPPGRGESRDADREHRRWPLYTGLAATWLLLALLVAGGPRASTAGFGLSGWTPWTYLLTQTGVIVRYLRLAFVPAPLVFDYFWPRVDSLWLVLPQAALLMLLIAATIFGVVRRHPLGFAGAWFFIILTPTSSVLPIVTEIAAEHRMYLPLAAVVAAVVIGTAVVVRGRLVPAQRAERWVAVGTIAILVLALGTLTRARNLDYSSERGLWLDTMAKQPDNPRARMSYGVDLLVAGRAAEAEPYLLAAVNLDDRDARALMNLGAAEYSLGKIDQAIGHLERALALRPDFTGARRNLAEAYAARHDDRRAVSNFERALDALPDDPATIHRLAWILATSKDSSVRDSQRAVTLAERAVELSGRRNAMFLNTLAAAYAGAGRLDDAVGATREAVAVARAQGRADEAAGLEKQLARLQEEARRSPR